MNVQLRVHVYTVCHNEEFLLPYFLRHYGRFAERIFVFDGQSSDRSLEILSADPKAVVDDSREFETHRDGKYTEPVLMRIRNEAYKRSRGKADWVIIADVDELVYHPEMLDLLTHYKKMGITLPSVSGYEMASMSPPRRAGQIYDEVRHGFKNDRYSKRAILDPALDINYSFGCHDCAPRGDVVQSDRAEIKLLHFRFLGPDFFVQKYSRRQARMHPESRAMKWGTHLTVPGPAGSSSIMDFSPEGLRRLFWQILSEQRIEDILP